MKKSRLLILALFASLASLMAPPAVRAQASPTTLPVSVQIFQGTDAGGYIQYSATLAAGQGLIMGSNGQLGPWTPPTIPTVLAQRAGTSTGTAGTSRAVTFTNPMPSTSYAIALTGASGIGALQLTYSAKTVNGFTINMSVSTASAIDWTATQNAN